MLKKLVLIWMLVGLLGVIPVLAAEDCDVKVKPEEAARDCDLKNQPVQQTKECIEEQTNKSSIKNSAEEQKQLKKDAKESNDILDELIKQ